MIIWKIISFVLKYEVYHFFILETCVQMYPISHIGLHRVIKNVIFSHNLLLYTLKYLHSEKSYLKRVLIVEITSVSYVQVYLNKWFSDTFGDRKVRVKKIMFSLINERSQWGGTEAFHWMSKFSHVQKLLHFEVGGCRIS